MTERFRSRRRRSAPEPTTFSIDERSEPAIDPLNAQQANVPDDAARLPPPQPPPLQHHIGDVAISPPQTDRTISQPGDPAEVDADRIASRVMRTPDASPALPEVDRPAGPSSSGPTGGEPLDDANREFMEPRFGHDFSHVRVHSGEGAARSAASLDAEAYTVGSDIVFGSGRYAPDTHSGRHLLAHELAHVVQQSTAASAGLPQVQRKATKVDAPFLGGSPFNDSSVTFTPRGELWINGAKTSTTNFPEGSDGTVQVRAGDSGILRIHMRLDVFEDNMVINESWDQDFSADWRVTTTPEGGLTLEALGVTVNSRSEGMASDGGLQQPVAQSQTSDTAIINPVIQGSGTTGGISIGVGMETSRPAHSITRPFRLRVEVIDIHRPEPTVTIGPVSVLRNHDVLFERPGQGSVSGAQEGRLITWYEGLNDATKEQIRSGALAVSLEGHASTTGDSQKNRELSNRRMEAVQEILRQYTGNRVTFDTRSVGEYQASTDDNVESQDERKVVVSVFEVISEGETSPTGGGAAPGP